jgi:hypothetical protein
MFKEPDSVSRNVTVVGPISRAPRRPLRYIKSAHFRPGGREPELGGEGQHWSGAVRENRAGPAAKKDVEQ